MIEHMKITFWAMADKLRGNMDASEYKDDVVEPIFVKFICDTLLPHLICAQLLLPDAEIIIEKAAA